MTNYKFCSTKDAAFSASLKKKVNNYFREQQLSRNANAEMVVKTITALSLYLVPYFVIILIAPANIPLLFGLWIAMGLGIAFIGTSVMHDSLHGSYSKSKKVNFVIGTSAYLLGVDAMVWKLQHNVLHHSYTNIEHADEDIEPRYVLRFSPHQPRRWFHRFQHIYAFFLYAISTLIWVTIKDFAKLFNYRKKGLIKSGRSFNIQLLGLTLRKLAYHVVFLVIPIYVLPIPAGLTVLMFVAMHLTAGLSLSLIFQPAHVIHSSEFINQEDEKIEENWSVHQLLTTCNFGMKTWWVSWFSGGLNHQIEHHLFPNICHIHYPKLAKIVQETTKEHGLPYHAKETFGQAVAGHFKMLKELGQGTI